VGLGYHYEYLAVDDADDTMGNVRLQESVGPLRIASVPLNMFVLDSKEALSDFFFTIK